MNSLKRNNVLVKGDQSQSIIFVHGFGCDQNMWRLIFPAFEKDYKIILIDLVGAGNSDLTAFEFEKYATLKGYASDIIEICEELDLKNITLVGHSVSGMIGGLVDIQKPGLLSNLIMIGPSPCYINHEDYEGGFEREDIEELLETMDSNYLGWSAQLAPSIMGNPDRPELGEELTNSFCRTDPTIAKHFARVTFLSDNRADLPNVTVPTLILQCVEDIIAPEVVGNYVNSQIATSQIVVMNASGHCPHLSAPQETIDHIHKFLDQSKSLN